MLFEHTFRTLFAKPLAAAIFLMINGLILLAGERLRRAAPTDEHTEDHRVRGHSQPLHAGSRHRRRGPTRRQPAPPCTIAKQA